MPEITAVTITLGRPDLLCQMIRQFELQSFQDRYLQIIDTGNHIAQQYGDRWQLRQLGHVDTEMWRTMNELISSTSSDSYAKLDDDDTYAPWHLDACVHALDKGMWAAPSVVWDSFDNDPTYKLHAFRTSAMNGRRDVCYAGSWSVRREAFESVGGYPPHGINEGECEYRDLLFAKFGPPVDTICDRFPMPSYVYRRRNTGVVQASTLQNNPEETMRQRTMKRDPVGTLLPRWPDKYLEGLPDRTTICPRQW